MKLLIPALATGLVSLYFFSRNRKVEVDVEMKMEPSDGEMTPVTAAPAYDTEH